MLKKYSYKINQIPFFVGSCLQTVMQKIRKNTSAAEKFGILRIKDTAC